MKKLSESRTLALTVLVILALLAVPLFGGLGLKTAQSRAAKAFSAIAGNTDQHGNDLFSDADRLIAAASSLLEVGKASASEEQVKKLEAAIKACKSEKNAVAKYDKSDALCNVAKSFFNSIGSGEADGAQMYYTEVDSLQSQIRRAYRAEYTDYLNTCSELTASWPASSIAKLWNIGG